MENIINKARIKQRSLVITRLDLNNAFVEVHHECISFVLSYIHVPNCIHSLISSFYIDFKTSITKDKYRSPAIPVSRGVLQRGCLSPLPVTIYFNTFIQFINCTWGTENLDNLVSKYACQWLDLHISATLSSTILSKNQFSLDLLPSVTSAKYQAVCRNSLRPSPNNEIKSLWKSTSIVVNIQYNVYKNIKHKSKTVRA